MVAPTFADIALLITSVGSLIAAVTGVVALFRIAVVHKTTNSKMDKMLKMAEAKGKREAEDEADDRAK